MRADWRAIETTGVIDGERRLHLDERLPIVGPNRVRVIILVSEEADLDEQSWLRSAAGNPAFEFLGDPAEDVYTASDGQPFDDAR
jgi:hypothetical protein